MTLVSQSHNCDHVTEFRFRSLFLWMTLVGQFGRALVGDPIEVSILVLVDDARGRFDLDEQKL